MVRQAVADPVKYATSFGYSGTYWDYVKEIAESGVDIKRLINLDISEDEVAEALQKAGFDGYRFDGALKWIVKTMDMLRTLI